MASFHNTIPDKEGRVYTYKNLQIPRYILQSRNS